MKIERIRILFTNVYILNLKGRRILIDTGNPLSKEDFFKKMRGIENVDFVILTHTHFDHSGNAIHLKENKAMIVVHKNEEDWLLKGETPKPEGVKYIGKTIMRFSFLQSLKFPPLSPDIVVSDYAKIEDLVIVYTPGHTPGSISIIYNNIAFCGDLIMNLTWRPYSHLPIFAHDIEKAKESIKKLVDMGVNIFYPGHGRPVRIENLKI